MRHQPIAFVLVAMLLGGAVAASQSPDRVSSRRVSSVPGEFVWHDLVTDNPAAARSFYGSLFGWTFEERKGIDPGYTVIKQDGLSIGGIVWRPRVAGETYVAQWLTYVGVPDVDDSVEVFRQQGGQVIRAPLTPRNGLRVAVVADPQGAPLGLASGVPRLDTATPPRLHRWLWMEYVARDVTAALSFYSKAVGFRHEIADTRENFTYYLLQTDRPRAGLFLSPWTRSTSAWLPYVRVADPAAMAARAVELGGTIALAPRPDVRHASLAIIVDPTGAALALQKFPFEQGGAQ
jgi:predicted enzyme related to lactoylglutathione lyase